MTIKTPVFGIAIAAATLLTLSGCSLSGINIPGVGVPGFGADPRCAAIETAMKTQFEASDEAANYTFDAYDISALDLPGDATLPAATCSYQAVSTAEDSKGTSLVIAYYLSTDETRVATIGDSLTTAGFTDVGSGENSAWTSPQSDDGGAYILSMSSVKDLATGENPLSDVLGAEGDVLTVIYSPEGLGG